MNEPILEAKKLCKTFGSLVAVQDVSLDINKNEIKIRTFFAPEMSRVIPVAKNRWFLSHPKSIIDNCIHELKNNQYKLKKPKGEIFEEAYHRTG